MNQFRGALLFVAFGVVTSGCSTLPDVKPFADSTAALATAAGTEYHTVANDVASLRPTRLPGESDSEFSAREQSFDNADQIIAGTDKKLDALFTSMTDYSEKLTNLVAAGNTGSAAAQSLLDSANGFARLGDISGFPAGTAATQIEGAFKAIADAFTRMQAAKSLASAANAAQPAVDIVAKEFKIIYGKAMLEANAYIRNTELQQATLAAGPHVIGFSSKVTKEYDGYYRVLIKLVAPVDAKAPDTAWRGFCQNKHGPCRAREELDAVGLVEARMAAIRPIVSAYDARIAAIDATYAQRKEESKALIRAVDAWALEHRKLTACLQDGTPLTALNLRVALSQLETLSRAK